MMSSSNATDNKNKSEMLQQQDQDLFFNVQETSAVKNAPIQQKRPSETKVTPVAPKVVTPPATQPTPSPAKVFTPKAPAPVPVAVQKPTPPPVKAPVA